jgi:hypothetical protein
VMRMIRKQVYVEPSQQAQLKELAKRLGVSEAEVIRQAIDRHMAAFHTRPDHTAWQAERAFINSLIERGQVPGRREWTRDDLYAGQAGRHDTRSG